MVLVTKIYAFALQNDMFCYKRNRFDAIISLPQRTGFDRREGNGSMVAFGVTLFLLPFGLPTGRLSDCGGRIK